MKSEVQQTSVHFTQIYSNLMHLKLYSQTGGINWAFCKVY